LSRTEPPSPTRLSFSDRIIVRISAFIAAGALVFSVLACKGTSSPPGADEAISKEAFMEAYYRLRTEGLRAPEMEISIEGRDRILAELELAEEDLLLFVEVWGSEGEVMRAIWEAVDSLMREDRRSRAEDPTLEGYEPGGEPGGEGERNLRGAGRG